MKVRLSHIALLVTDLAKAQHFYGNILGFQEINRPPFFIKGLWYSLGESELHLMLHEQAASPQFHPLSETVQPHFALSVTQAQITTILKKLKNAGVEPMLEPKKSSAGVWQIFFYDFDKNMIEFNYEA